MMRTTGLSLLHALLFLALLNPILADKSNTRDIKPSPKPINKLTTTDFFGTATSSYFSNQELEAWLKGYAVRCSNISRLSTFGHSIDSAPLFVLEITDNPGEPAPKPVVRLTANIHGDEILGRNLVLGLAEWLCANYNTNSTAQRIVSDLRLMLVPTLNPDGYTAKTRVNAHGFDLNRDFPDQFVNPSCSVNGTGTEQPETLAMMKLALAHPCTASISFHGGALVASYPWDGTKNGSSIYNAAPDDKTFRYLARAYALHHSTMASGNEEFKGGITNGAKWYSLYGGMQDWNYICTGCLELTIEVGVKWPDEGDLEAMFNQNFPAILAYLEKGGLGGIGGRVTAAVTVGVDASNATGTERGGNRKMLSSSEASSASSSSSSTTKPLYAAITLKGINHTIHTDPETGYFHRVVAPGRYTILVTADGYKPANSTITVPYNNPGLVRDFQLTPL